MTSIYSICLLLLCWPTEFTPLLASSIQGDIKSQFIWYKQPNISMPWTQEWKGTVLAENAADSFLIMGDMSTPDGVIRTFITAGYFSKSLDIWWQKDRTKPWTTDNASISFTYINFTSYCWDTEIAQQ